jgi:hypothetical protein
VDVLQYDWKVESWLDFCWIMRFENWFRNGICDLYETFAVWR